jgi:hypothetical protein
LLPQSEWETAAVTGSVTKECAVVDDDLHPVSAEAFGAAWTDAALAVESVHETGNPSGHEERQQAPRVEQETD